MKKTIIAGVLLIMLSVMNIVFLLPTTVKAYEEQNEVFIVKQNSIYNDLQIKKMNIEQLTEKIENHKNLQETAHTIAESARALGWPEDSQTILNAQAQWHNSELARCFYEKALIKKKSEIEESKWATKYTSYPVATTIWKYMKSLNWNDAVCAGILGNIMVEAGNQSLNIQPEIYGQGYYGVCQWNQGYNSVWGTSLDYQCTFLRDTIANEFNSFGFMYAKDFNFDSFLILDNPAQAAIAFAKCYERCDSKTYILREKCAYSAYDYFIN